VPHSIKVDGSALRVIRERSELSIADVVEAIREQGIDVHPDHLRNIELGYRQASPKLLGALAGALKVAKIELIQDPAKPKLRKAS